jgi:hypothetical protein
MKILIPFLALSLGLHVVVLSGPFGSGRLISNQPVWLELSAGAFQIQRYKEAHREPRIRSTLSAQQPTPAKESMETLKTLGSRNGNSLEIEAYIAFLMQQVRKSRKLVNLEVNEDESKALRVSFLVRKNGEIQDVKFIEGGGQEFQQAVLSALEDLNPVEPLPEKWGMDYVRFTLPIRLLD